MKEKIQLNPEQLIPNVGQYLVTKNITTLGKKVGYMFREEPAYSEDSGWRFFSGTNQQEYLDNPDHTSITDVNIIANYDPDIIPLLDAPIGKAFRRDPADGELKEIILGSEENNSPELEVAVTESGERIANAIRGAVKTLIFALVSAFIIGGIIRVGPDGQSASMGFLGGALFLSVVTLMFLGVPLLIIGAIVGGIKPVKTNPNHRVHSIADSVRSE